MNSVQSLIMQPFSGRSRAEIAEIKRLGRPTPNLIIQQSTNCKSKTVVRKFSVGIYNKHEWICGCDTTNALFCFPCLLFGGEKLWTQTGFINLSHLSGRARKHELTAQHMKNVVRYSFLRAPNIVGIAVQLDSEHRRNTELHNERVKHNRYILNKIIDCVRFCGAFRLALKGHESTTSSNSEVFHGLIDFRVTDFSIKLNSALKEHLEKATVLFKETSKNIQNDILETMFSVCQEEVSREIREADYLSVIVEETNDVSDILQMAIIFRYITKGKPVERFWDFITPADYCLKTVSSNILTELEKHLEGDRGKLIAQTYDGATVMRTVQSVVKQTYKHAVYIHYYAHQLDIVMLNAASVNTNVYIFFANLQGICTFFSESPEPLAILNVIVKKRSSCLVPKRWNLNSKVVYTLFEHREDIIETMQTILNKSRNITTINQASGYIKILASNSFISWLNLFHKVMPHIDKLSAKFKTKQMSSALANKSLSLFETHLRQIRDSLPNFPDTNGQSASYPELYKTAGEDVCNIIISQTEENIADLPDNNEGSSDAQSKISDYEEFALETKEVCDIDISESKISLADLPNTNGLVNEHSTLKRHQTDDYEVIMSESNTNGFDDTSSSKRRKTDDYTRFTQEAKEVCDIIICEAKERFSFTSHLIMATLLFPEKYHQYHDRFPDQTFLETVEAYPFFNIEKLRTELTVLYETEEFRSISGLIPLYNYLSQSSDLTDTFSETIKLIKILITIPMASTEAERSFSTLNEVKTFLRNTLGQKQLSALMMLSKEKDLIDSIPDFNERVINKFAIAKHRRVNFIFQ